MDFFLKSISVKIDQQRLFLKLSYNHTIQPIKIHVKSQFSQKPLNRILKKFQKTFDRVYLYYGLNFKLID